MVKATEKLVRKFVKGYERGRGSGAYVSSADFQNMIGELISQFSGICIGIQRDRGQGLFLSVLSAETRTVLYFVRVRNTNARGLDRSKVRYSLTVENRDLVLEVR